MVTSDVSSASRATRRTRRRAVLMAVITVGIIGVLAITGGSTLTESATTFGHLDWRWVPLAIVAEASSMAAFARTQRRLLRAGGTNLHLRSAMAVTYAGNAISVSLPLAGPEAATGFVYRRYGRLGIDEAVVAWALAVSGMFSSLAFALVLLGGAAASPNTTCTTLGLVGAAIALLPSVTVLALAGQAVT